MEKEILYTLALHLMEGIGGVKARQLISYCGSSQAVFQLPKAKLLKIPQIGEKIASALQESSLLREAEQELEKAQKNDVQVLSYHQPKYPQRLKQTYDAPLVLFSKGNTDFNLAKSVAIVGTREATEYGKAITEEIVGNLQKHQPIIVSGLAYGIDIAAHRACLKFNIPTVGVMASGVDNIYPSVHKNTVSQMLQQNGSILTENRLGTKPDAMRFPARNRVIAGMADVIIVVEAKSKGGALITADIANDYNREVMAVPGNLHKSSSEGCNNLIKAHKAHLFTDISDLENLLNWSENATTIPAKQVSLNFDKSSLSVTEQKIIATLESQSKQAYPIDELSWLTQVSIQEINSAVLNLELLGLIKSLPGKKYSLF